MPGLSETLKRLKDCPECAKRKEEAMLKLFPHMTKKREVKDAME